LALRAHIASRPVFAPEFLYSPAATISGEEEGHEYFRENHVRDLWFGQRGKPGTSGVYGGTRRHGRFSARRSGERRSGNRNLIEGGR